MQYFRAIILSLLMVGGIPGFGHCDEKVPLQGLIEKPQKANKTLQTSTDDELNGLSQKEVFARVSSLNASYSEVRSNKPKKKSSSGIILHFKSKGGIKFEKIEVDKEAKEKILAAISQVAEKDYTAMLGDFEKEVHQTERIPLCKEDKEKLLMPLRELEKDTKAQVQPVLMLQRDLIPQDEKIAYGITTKLMSFDIVTVAGLPEFMKRTGFECLPLRMHVTKKGLVLIEGKNALKNYDQDEKGRLDPGVERLWRALEIRYRSEEFSGTGGKLTSLSKSMTSN